MKKDLDKKNEIAISVKNVSKTFRIPHERITSLRGAAVSLFKKKTYEEFKALDDVSFEVKKGEFFGVIGRNGSGKSTLLKILAGIYEADKGRVKVNGMISPFLELGIGFNPELSGRDNIYLNATVLGMSKKEIDKKFDSIVKFSELERFIDQKLKNYSSGMQVRLAFSVSIHANREILLMDEVLAVGDTNFQSKCIREFIKYKETGKTVVLVTHDIATVQQYCDRVMLLRNGNVINIGNAEDVSNEYIHWNIADKEKNTISKKEKIKSGSNIAHTKVVEIMDLKLLDINGVERTVFKTGEYMDMKIEFKMNKKNIDLLNVGIGFHSILGGQVFGYNTQMDKFLIKNHKNSIVLRFKEMPILKGSYYLNVVCFGNIEHDYYDLRTNFREVEFLSDGIKNNYKGFVDIEHEWL